MLRRIGRLIFQHIPLWTWRACLYGSLGALVVVGGMILGLRYWVLPNIDAYRGDLEQALTRATGQRITIGEIGADWQGLRPQFSLGKVVVHDQAGRAALALERIDTALSWVSLIVLEPRFDTLQIHRPSLDIRRAQDGTLSVAGIELRDSREGGGLADWIFRQREVIITEAVISWIDEQRQAPELRLRDVTLRLQNDYFRHRLALTAVAPAELASPLDLRADLVGRSVNNIAEWEGQLYVKLDYVDLAASKQWVDMPIEIAQGRGAVRTWIDVAQHRVTAVTADVRLSDVKTRLAPELEQLDLTSLSGRIGWRGWGGGFDLSARGLQGIAVAGHSFASDVFSLRRVHEQPNKPARTELKANVVDLDALAQLAEHIPIEQALRDEIKRYRPRGKLYDFSAKWTGVWGRGLFAFASRFEDLAFEAVDDMPGWRSVTGSVDANEKGGILNLVKHPLHIHLPKVFSEPLAFDEFSGSMQWTASGGRIDFRLSDVRFANADIAGSLSGIYHSVPGEIGRVDLTGALTRASAAGVARYIPLMVGKETRDWVRSSVIAGHSNDVKLKLKGNLAEFPFDRNSKGVFEVTAKTRDAVLDYANGWPRMENITADLVFTGRRVNVRASGGRILGAQISGVQATIPDLVTLDEILELSGDATGPTAEFVRFIAESPVAGMIDRATEGIEAQGAGRLSLRMTMPLRRAKDTRIVGSYLLQENRLRVHPDLPALEQVSGRIEFSEAMVRGQGIAGQIFGGPVLIALATEDGAVTATGSGRSNVDALREYLDSPVLQGLSGSAEWRGSMSMRGKQTDFTVESDLRGLTSDLPPPLAKGPEDVLALRLERRASGNEGDQIDFRLGDVLRGHFVRRREGRQLVVERGAIGFGVEPPAAEGPGLWIRGKVANLDLDRWRAVAGAGAGGSDVLPPLARMDLEFGTLDVLGRSFHGVSLSAGQKAGDWRAQVSARELAGEIGWRPQGKGQIVARLQRLSLPASTERVGAAVAQPAQQPVEYPALDVVVEDFQRGGRSLGRLQVLAVAEGRNWHIERLDLRNPDGTFTADGLWHWQARVPRTEMRFRLEVADIGKFLARLGYPEGVKGGAATLSGALSWAGAPQDLDTPSLSGKMSVDAAKGQFVKLEPGIGKLLSILSLQALPRRVTLDFKDVFSEGFAFDKISGEVKVDSGVASTESFRINGSSAAVAMSGAVDLARETQKLRVRVVPSVGDSVATVTALLGGPVAGLGVFLAQRLLNDPLGQLVAYDYSVTGTWADPTIVKLGIDRAEPG